MRRFDSGDSDRRLVLLAKGVGKTDAVARGAKKSASRLAGSCEPMSHAQFTLSKGRVRSFVTSAQPLSSFPRVRTDFGRLNAGLAVCEVTALAVPFGRPSDSEFQAVLDTLRSLDSNEKWEPVLCWYLVRLLCLEGHSPSWTVCTATGKPASANPTVFSLSSGGMLTTGSDGTPGNFTVPVEALIALHKLESLGLPPSHLKFADTCLWVLQRIWEHHLEHKLPALEGLVRMLIQPDGYNKPCGTRLSPSSSPSP